MDSKNLLKQQVLFFYERTKEEITVDNLIKFFPLYFMFFCLFFTPPTYLVLMGKTLLIKIFAPIACILVDIVILYLLLYVDISDPIG